MNFAVNSASWGLTQILPLFNAGTLVMYNNPQPATPETALPALIPRCARLPSLLRPSARSTSRAAMIRQQQASLLPA